jgi:hypothetical protein
MVILGVPSWAVNQLHLRATATCFSLIAVDICLVVNCYVRKNLFVLFCVVSKCLHVYVQSRCKYAYLFFLVACLTVSVLLHNCMTTTHSLALFGQSCSSSASSSINSITSNTTNTTPNEYMDYNDWHFFQVFTRRVYQWIFIIINSGSNPHKKNPVNAARPNSPSPPYSPSVPNIPYNITWNIAALSLH